MDNLGDRVKAGTNIVAQILNGADVKVEKNVLEAIENRNPDIAQEIKEQMFKAKLTAFELPFVKNSDKRDLKAKLRRAESFKDIIWISISTECISS